MICTSSQWTENIPERHEIKVTTHLNMKASQQNVNLNTSPFGVREANCQIIHKMRGQTDLKSLSRFNTLHTDLQQGGATN